MTNLVNWFRSLFTPSEQVKQDAQILNSVTEQAVYYSREGDTYVNLHSKVDVLTRTQDGIIYGTTVVNGVIHFCFQVYPQVWQVLNESQSRQLGEKIKNTLASTQN